jgi:hypothetical protein
MIAFPMDYVFTICFHPDPTLRRSVYGLYL